MLRVILNAVCIALGLCFMALAACLAFVSVFVSIYTTWTWPDEPTYIIAALVILVAAFASAWMGMAMCDAVNKE